jgi:hypothetical protein
MEDPELERLVRHSIRDSAVPPDLLRKLERAGEQAFDLIAKWIDKALLSEREIVNALGRLAIITRHQCPDRQQDVLRIALSLFQHPSRVVRSRAANASIAWVHVFEHSSPHLRVGSLVEQTPAIREQVQNALRDVLERGIEEDQVEYVRRFLANEI